MRGEWGLRMDDGGCARVPLLAVVGGGRSRYQLTAARAVTRWLAIHEQVGS
jgi:hypothetical protein